jgi:rhodanese-related sulfurtransferase
MPIKTVDANTLKEWLVTGVAVLVDVREPAEFQAESIKGAQLVSLSGVCKSALPDCAGKKIVIQCHSGRRSFSACEKLAAENPELEIYNLEGGITAWKDAGYLVENSGKFFLPLDRQVQLAIGVCIFISSLLAYFVSPNFLLLTGFFGLGLSFAGITGFCGLALIMAKMPWNSVNGGSCCGCSSAKSSCK